MCYNDATNTRGDGSVAFDQTAYKNEFNRQKYDRVIITLPKGRKDEIKEIAKRDGISMNEAILFALEKTYGINLSN